jgi:hypothetical protein
MPPPISERLALMEAEMNHMRISAAKTDASLASVLKAVQDNRETNIKITAYGVAILGLLNIVLATLKFFI